MSNYRSALSWISSISLFASLLVAPAVLVSDPAVAGARDGNCELGGSGTEADPYRVTSYEKLFDELPDCDGAGVHFLMTDNFDMSGETNPFNPIPELKGIFDGGGHFILGMTIVGSQDSTAAGLFEGLLDGSVLRNLNLVSPEVTITNPGNVGSFFAFASGATLQNLAVYEPIIQSPQRANFTNSNAGGVGGRVANPVKVENVAVVLGDSGAVTGGVVGGLFGELRLEASSPSVSFQMTNVIVEGGSLQQANPDTDFGYVGGVVGEVSGYLDGDATDLNLNFANVRVGTALRTNANSASSAGGLIGFFYADQVLQPNTRATVNVADFVLYTNDGSTYSEGPAGRPMAGLIGEMQRGGTPLTSLFLNADRVFVRGQAQELGTSGATAVGFLPVVTDATGSDANVSVSNYLVDSETNPSLPTTYPLKASVTESVGLAQLSQTNFDVQPNLTFNPQAKFYKYLGDLFPSWAREYFYFEPLFGNKVENGNLLPEVEILGADPSNANLELTVSIGTVTPTSLDIGLSTQYEAGALTSGARYSATPTYSNQLVMTGTKAQLEEMSRKIYLAPGQSTSNLEVRYQIRDTAANMTIARALPVTVTACSLSGTGTGADPYLVGSAADLRIVGQCLDPASVKHFRQTANINLQGMNHIPIGHDYLPFNGVYDGDGHIVDGLSIDRPLADDIGLFGRIGDGGTLANTQVEIKNLTVVGETSALIHGGLVAGFTNSGKFSNVEASGDVMVRRTGALISGEAKNAEFKDVRAFGSVYGTSISSTTTEVGLLVGEMINTEFEVDDVVIEGTVTGEIDQIGGLIGVVDSDPAGSTISNVSARVNVIGRNAYTSNNIAEVGGLVGFSQDVDYESIIVQPLTENFVEVGGVTVLESKIGLMDVENIGGMIGRSSEDGIFNSILELEVMVESAGSNVDFVGGLMGTMRRGYVQNVDVSSTVSGGEQTGGLVGKMLPNRDMTIKASTFTGNVNGLISTGGLVGEIEPGDADSNPIENEGDVLIESSAFDGAVVGTNKTGGLVGFITDAGGKSVTIKTSEVSGTVRGSAYVAGAVGQWEALEGEAIVDSVNVSGTVTGTSGMVGGVIGNLLQRGSVFISGVFADAIVQGTTNVGGLIGYVQSDNTAETTVEKSSVRGSVSASQGSAAGGIAYIKLNQAGESTAQISELDVAANVAGKDFAGGILGEVYLEDDKKTLTISQVAYRGEVTAAIGNVAPSAGGLVGALQLIAVANKTSSFDVADSLAYGKVMLDHSSGAVGGLVGKLDNRERVTFARSYALNEVAKRVGSTASTAGFVGDVAWSTLTGFSDNFYSAEQSGTPFANDPNDIAELASDLPPAAFAEAASFTNFDIEQSFDVNGSSVWTYCPVIQEGSPVLRWEVQARDLTSCSLQTTVPAYSGPVVTGATGSGSAVGTIEASRFVEIFGSRLGTVSSVRVNSVELEIVEQNDERILVRVPNSIPNGSYDLQITSDSGLLTVQDGLTISSDGVESVQQVAASGWTSLKGDFVKVYAKNIVSAGKVQFFHNGREIAWVRAADETDPKLRRANGFSYLVRSVFLMPGKNIFEIYVDGERVRRTAYTLR